MKWTTWDVLIHLGTDAYCAYRPNEAPVISALSLQEVYTKPNKRGSRKPSVMVYLVSLKFGLSKSDVFSGPSSTGRAAAFNCVRSSPRCKRMRNSQLITAYNEGQKIAE